MFRIRRVFDDSLLIDREEIAHVQAILRERFVGAPSADADELPERLKNPMRFKFRSLLFVADDLQGKVHGFAMVLHDRANDFLYLDFIATGKGRVGSGVGGALYERVREEGHALGVVGVFFECLPDTRDECPDDAAFKENVARLRFYERYGARPIVGTEYEAPVAEATKGMPHLVFDDLDTGKPLRAEQARRVVRGVLENRYDYLVGPEYVEKVVRSFRADPVLRREPRYFKKVSPVRPAADRTSATIVLVVNAKHEIHHVRDRGYVEAPARIRVIRKELDESGLFREIQPRHYPERHILAVHDKGYFEYFKRVCKGLPEGRSVYPYVFPVRNRTRPPREVSVRAGYYCIDTFTPLNRNALAAATRGVDCALTAADAILMGDRIAYALIRPPGHHAERGVFGGFCYLNNGAIAAHYLSGRGKVAILDVDYHHGNGQQNIFYERSDVLTVSIHGHPSFAYPYFTGFAEEAGAGAGEGFNLNLPLRESIDTAHYSAALGKALARVEQHEPSFLVVSLGLDTAKGDPTGTWRLSPADIRENGRRIGALGLPTVVVQEGGYRTRTLGANARAFFTGLDAGLRGLHPDPKKREK